MPLKTAVVGAGVMGNSHLKQLNEIPDVRVVAVVDPYEPNLRATAERHHVPAAYTDIESMLTAEHPDYVVVTSPVKYHAPQAIAAIEAGAHVLVEKPLCMDVTGAEAIEAAAKREGRLFTMGFQRRQSRAMRALRRFIEDGKLGAIYHSRVWGGHTMGYAWGRYHHRKDQSLGGVAAATVVHELDLCIWVIGTPEPVTVSASTFRRLDKMPDPYITFEGAAADATVEDFAHAHVRFADGSSMSIEGNWLMHPGERGNGFDINGVLGVARDRHPFVELERGREVIAFELDHDPEPEIDSYRLEHMEFIEVIQGQGRPLVTFREALVVQRILAGLYESAEQGREVKV